MNNGGKLVKKGERQGSRILACNQAVYTCRFNKLRLLHVRGPACIIADLSVRSSGAYHTVEFS